MKKDYVVAIPSYKRPNTLKTKTLRLLEHYNIDPKKVTIFVANEEEKQVYAEALADTPYTDLVVGVAGMGAIRRFIQQYYPEGEYVMQFDDDIQQFLRKLDDRTRMPQVDDLEAEVIIRGFEACERNEAYMFGIYAASNKLFLKHRISIGLYYCVGSCWGVINRKDKAFSVTLDDKEDFERTLQHYVHDGKVVRIDNITLLSKYYTEGGGMQETRTADRVRSGAEYLVAKYPDLCKIYTRKSSNLAELRLRDTVRKTNRVSSEALV